jgi:hypothetical protein
LSAISNAEGFLQTSTPPVSAHDQVLMLWLVNELVSTVVDYSPTRQTKLRLCLAYEDRTFRLALSGTGGIEPIAHELTDSRVRCPAMDILTTIASRWGSQTFPDDTDHIWVELDLGRRTLG